MNMGWKVPVHFQRFSSQVLSLFCQNGEIINLYKERRHVMGKLKEQMKMDMELNPPLADKELQHPND